MAYILENMFQIKFATPAESRFKVTTKYLRSALGTNFQFLIKIDFVSNFFKYTEYKMWLFVK